MQVPNWSAVGRVPAVRVLRQPAYGILAVGFAASQLGTWVQDIAVLWLAWVLTESEAWLGVIAFCQFSPTLLLGPLAGALADRRHQLRILLIGQLLGAVQATTLLMLALTGNLTIHGLVGAVLFLGVTTTFALTSMRVLVTKIVPPDLIAAAVSVNSISFNTARFTGPAVAGLLIHFGHVELCFLLNAISFIVYAAALEVIRRRGLAPPSPPRPPGGRISLMREMADGFGYAVRHRVIRLLLLIYLAYAAMGRPLIDLLPAIVGEVLQADSGALALLTSVFGATAIVSGLLMSLVTRPQALWFWMSAALAALGVGTFGVTQGGGLGVAIVAMVVFAAGQNTINIASQTLTQLFVDADVRGRVMALHFMIFRGGASLGGLAIGVLAEVFGLGPVFLCTGLILCVAAGLSLAVSPAGTTAGEDASP